MKVDCAGRCDAMRGWDRVKEVKQGKKEHSQKSYADFFVQIQQACE